MARYGVVLVQTASTYIEVEADDREAAVEAAIDKAPSGLCAQCSGWGQEVGIEMAGDWELPTELDGSESESAVTEL